MKQTLVLPCLLLAITSGVALAQSTGTVLRQLLPNAAVDAEVLQLWSPPALADLSARLQAAAKADPAWWRAHTQKAVPGLPLPYDARMGLTEPEYHQFLALTDSVHMRPSTTVRLALLATPTGWRFADDGPVVALKGIEIDTVADVIRTPVGTLGTKSTLKPTAAQRATGPWGGPQWKLEDFDQATSSGTVASFAVGQLVESGRVLIYFDARKALNGTLTTRSSTMLRLPAPASRP